MAVLHLTTETFETEVLQYQGKVLVDFFATWCGPCKMVAPIIEEVAEEAKDVKVCKVDVDDCGEIAEKYNVMSIPTLAVFENGEVKEISVGFKPKAAILEMLK